MNYILKKVEVNGNADMYGGSDTETEIGISKDQRKLIDYCKFTYDCEPSIGKPQKFEWVYYTIEETKMIII
jgi:hypothetical protein